jgi:hypothetical protein
MEKITHDERDGQQFEHATNGLDGLTHQHYRQCDILVKRNQTDDKQRCWNTDSNREYKVGFLSVLSKPYAGKSKDH